MKAQTQITEHVGKQKLEHILNCQVCQMRIEAVISGNMTPSHAAVFYRPSAENPRKVSR